MGSTSGYLGRNGVPFYMGPGREHIHPQNSSKSHHNASAHRPRSVRTFPCPFFRFQQAEAVYTRPRKKPSQQTTPFCPQVPGYTPPSAKKSYRTPFCPADNPFLFNLARWRGDGVDDLSASPAKEPANADRQVAGARTHNGKHNEREIDNACTSVYIIDPNVGQQADNLARTGNHPR